jgi:hypothetical protein
LSQSAHAQRQDDWKNRPSADAQNATSPAHRLMHLLAQGLNDPIGFLLGVYIQRMTRNVILIIT